MNRYTPRQSAEFEARQQCFDFGMACRFVAATVCNVKKSLQSWVSKFFKKPEPKRPHQSVLELDEIAQMPLLTQAC